MTADERERVLMDGAARRQAESFVEVVDFLTTELSVERRRVKYLEYQVGHFRKLWDRAQDARNRLVADPDCDALSDVEDVQRVGRGSSVVFDEGLDLRAILTSQRVGEVGVRLEVLEAHVVEVDPLVDDLAADPSGELEGLLEVGQVVELKVRVVAESERLATDDELPTVLAHGDHGSAPDAAAEGDDALVDRVALGLLSFDLAEPLGFEPSGPYLTREWNNLSTVGQGFYLSRARAVIALVNGGAS